MTTQEIADKLVSYCRNAEWETAQLNLFADDAVSIESQPNPTFPKETTGRAAIIEKGKKFEALIENVHALTVSEPIVAESAFACRMAMDVTMKGQPRMQMSEICVYQVKAGKIISEQFFG